MEICSQYKKSSVIMISIKHYIFPRFEQRMYAFKQNDYFYYINAMYVSFFFFFKFNTHTYNFIILYTLHICRYNISVEKLSWFLTSTGNQNFTTAVFCFKPQWLFRSAHTYTHTLIRSKPITVNCAHGRQLFFSLLWLETRVTLKKSSCLVVK